MLTAKQLYLALGLALVFGLADGTRLACSCDPFPARLRATLPVRVCHGARCLAAVAPGRMARVDTGVVCVRIVFVLAPVW